MINEIIAGLIIAVLAIRIAFLLYLMMTDQRIRYHDQNLTDGKSPMWRHGRCWWSIESRDTEHWRQGPGASAEWSFSRHETFALGITVLDDEGDDIQFHIGIPFLVGFWFTLERLPVLDRLPYRWRRNFGYETSVKIHSGSLWIHFIHSEMWGTQHGGFRWLPRWISIATSAGYKEWRGVGFYICFDFDRLIFGSYERTEHNIGEPVRAEIPIEPDNTLGFHYVATFQRQQEVRWRGNFPWRKKRDTYWEISADSPPLHAGKGENSYDLDDDGIFGCSVHGDTIEEAVAEYVKKCQRDRDRYGMPGAIVAMFWSEEDRLIEENIRAAFRGEYDPAESHRLRSKYDEPY